MRKLLAALAVTLLAVSACGDGPTPPVTGGGEIRAEVVYITQATQNRDGSVPLVAGRDGILRIFLVASQPTPAPALQVQLFHGQELKQTLTIPAPTDAVPSSVNQGNLGSSWNARLSGALIQPGLRVQVSLASGATLVQSRAINVADLPPLRIRFVPIHQVDNGLTGRVDEQNKHRYLELTQRIFPIPGYDADVRAPYSIRFLEVDPQGNTWQSLVSELDAVRVAEGSDRYYYGVVQTPYPGGGVVGIAAGIPSRTSLGWDRFPDADFTTAHELGHNWGRRHAPCGGAGGPDPNFPYNLGLIGAFGMDVETGQLKPPSAHSDVMGYCVQNFWISDYTYTAVLNHRLAEHRASTAAQPSLLVWGRMHNGRLVLEPAFHLTTRPELPETPGPFRIEGRDENDRIVFAHSFAAEPIPDIAGDHRTFAFAIPLDGSRVERLRSLRLVGFGSEVRVDARERQGGGALQTAAQPRALALQRTSVEQVAVRWDEAAHPMVMVRNPRTGEILSLARGGAATLHAAVGTELEVIASDGVHSSVRRARVGAF